MLIKCLPVGHLMTNCYIVTDETTLECAVIDPGDESNTILYSSRTTTSPAAPSCSRTATTTTPALSTPCTRRPVRPCT